MSEQVKAIVERMLRAEIDYGCGFYSDDAWLAAYDELAALLGFDKEWRDAREVERSARLDEERDAKLTRMRKLVQTKREGKDVNYG